MLGKVLGNKMQTGKQQFLRWPLWKVLTILTVVFVLFRESESGLIVFDLNDKKETVTFDWQNSDLRRTAQFGDKVRVYSRLLGLFHSATPSMFIQCV